jgi:hypothetical protein
LSELALKYVPQPKQQKLHESVANELLYGGAAGPGKSHALRQEAFLWAQRVPGLQVYLFRRTYPELEKNHIIPSQQEFPQEAGIYKEQKRRWEFRNGSMLHFSHCQYEKDVFGYQGAEIHLLLIDELTAFTEFMYDYLRGRVRSTLDVPLQYQHRIPGIVAGTNPGGIGHEFCKRRWVDFCHLTGDEPALYRSRGDQIHEIATAGGGQKYYGCRRAPKREGGMLRAYIPGKLTDNPILMERDPEYIHRLDALPEPYRTAYKEGDWDLFFGQAFAFTPEHHVIQPRPVPDYVPVYFTFDWGFGAPFSCGWWWVDADNRLYRFSEWYGWNGSPNQGLRWPDSKVAEGIKQREASLGFWEAQGPEGELVPARKVIRLAGPDCFQKKPDYRGGGQGMSTAEVLSAAGIHLSPGDPSRHLKIRQFHERLRIDRPGGGPPMMLVYNTCKQFIRTIPLLQADEHDPEDIDTTGEDHVYDEASHICMARPIGLSDEAIMEQVREAKRKEKINALDEPSRAASDELARILAQIKERQEEFRAPGDVSAGEERVW